MSATTDIAGPEPLPRGEILTIGLIAAAHGCSHFFQLVLPPLFPFLIAELDTGYTELGALMTLFFITSGIGQPIAGMLVDRLGARAVLLAGLAVYVASVLAMAAAPSLPMLIPAVVLAGVGNSVFHPADYTVLTASVRPTHHGRAYGAHTLGGNLGWAIAPAFMLAVAALAGWRAALVAAAAVGGLIWLALWLNRTSLRADRDGERTERRRKTSTPRSVDLLLHPAVVLCFGYFTLIAAALIAVQNFLAPILDAVHRTPLAVGAGALTGFLVGASAGVVAGAVVADRPVRHTGVIAAGLASSAVLFVVVAHVDLPTAALVGVLFAAGFLSGVTTPSRDMLVRSATPRGATGRVFGFVYSGLDVGSALAPVAVGLLVDSGFARAALWAVAALLLAAIGTAVLVRPTSPA